MGKDYLEQLVKICNLFGSSKLIEFIFENNFEHKEKIINLLSSYKYNSTNWKSFLNIQNSHLYHPLAIDLLTKLLIVKPVV